MIPLVSHMQKTLTPKTHLFFLILLFLTPWFLARFLYNHHHWIKFPGKNYGILITPTITADQLPIDSSSRRWKLVLFYPGSCEAKCQKSLHDLHQIRLATGPDRERVEYALASFEHHSTGEISIFIDPTKFNEVFQKHHHTVEPGTIFLIDPNGNFILQYPPNASPSGILKDIQHLMKISQIG